MWTCPTLRMVAPQRGLHFVVFLSLLCFTLSTSEDDLSMTLNPYLMNEAEEMSTSGMSSRARLAPSHRESPFPIEDLRWGPSHPLEPLPYVRGPLDRELVDSRKDEEPEEEAAVGQDAKSSPFYTSGGGERMMRPQDRRATELLEKRGSPIVKKWWGGYYRTRPQIDRRASQSKHYGCLKRCISTGKLHPIQCHTLC